MLLALTGVGGSLLAAGAIARSDARQSRARMRAAASQIAARLELGIEREQDLLVSGAAFLEETPNASPARFWRWVGGVKAAQRHPEVVGVGDSTLVSAARLPALEARVAAEPPQAGSRLPFELAPGGARPYYCLLSAVVARFPVPPGTDYCVVEPLMKDTISSGANVAYAADVPGLGRLLSVLEPVYRTGSIPTSVPARRTAFVGWIGLVVVPKVLLDQALQGYPGVRVVLNRRIGATMAFSAGRAAGDAAAVTIDLRNGSTVKVLGSVNGAGIFQNANSALLLAGGGLLSLLLAALIYELGTGRARARRQVEQKTRELSFQALHDGLTGLPNRLLVLDRAEQALARARRTHLPVAALFLDADGFKSVNDTFGHAAGDVLLRAIAARLTGVVRESDTVGRLGGDEFVVLLEPHDLDVAPELVAERVLDVLAQPVEIADGKMVTISASIGIAAGERDSAERLLRDADLALYAAKAAGKNRYMIFEASMQTAATDRYLLEADLQAALADGQLFLVYQPTFDLQTGAATGVEALLRWQHPTRGLIGPDQFIPIAEENGQIIDIGAWVLDTACQQAAAWHARGHTIGMSVNVSARQVEQDEFVDTVADALSRSTLDPCALTLEITETVLMRDAEKSADRLHALKRLGVRIAIDDFGTGYSSLAYLRQFPVDALKIDRAFISGISASSESGALMHTLVQLGKRLGLETLGEGIEDTDQLERLRREQCDSGQGFLLARPLTVDAVEEFFERTKPRADIAWRPASARALPSRH